MESAELGVDLDDNAELSPERVEHYMRAHRRDFEKSRQQQLFCELDSAGGLPICHVKKRMDNRFHSMCSPPPKITIHQLASLSFFLLLLPLLLLRLLLLLRPWRLLPLLLLLLLLLPLLLLR